MKIANLPTTVKQWKRYFDTTLQYIRNMLPMISFGHNKADFILTNIIDLHDQFFKDHPPSVSPKESRTLFEFFKTCATFVSFCYNYRPKNMLNYFLTKPINEQFNEMALLWSSWSLHASSLLLFKSSCFLDVSQLYYAHFLDLKTMYDTFKQQISQIPEPFAKQLQAKLDEIQSVLSKFKTEAGEEEEEAVDGFIKHDDYDYVKLIGSGHFSKVGLAKMKDTEEMFAIKQFTNEDLNQQAITAIKRELNTIIKFDHPNVLKYIGVTLSSPFVIATKYAPNGTLYDAIHKEDGEKLTGTEKMKIALGMARGLEYLEALQYVHRNFKSTNILLEEDCNALISDFTFSRPLGAKMTHEIGNIEWTAPEVLASSGNYDTSCDIYSYGIILYELITEQLPYKDMMLTQIANNVVNGNLRPTFEEPVSPIHSLIEKCWKAPEDRPTASEWVEWLMEEEHAFPDTEWSEYIEWANETHKKHAEIIVQAKEMKEKDMCKVISRLHNISPLHPSTFLYLQRLYTMNYPLTLELFEDVLKLTNQKQSVVVQTAAFDILKQILSREDLFDTISLDVIIDNLIPMLDTEPVFVTAAIRIISPKVPDAIELSKRFLSIPQTHVTVEIIQILISHSPTPISNESLINIYNSLTSNLAVGFFHSMLEFRGPLVEFLPLALHSLLLLSLYLEELASLCKDDFEKVQEIIQQDSLKAKNENDASKLIGSVSAALMSQHPEITEDMAIFIYRFLINQCFIYNETIIILPLLILASNVESIKKEIAESDSWNLIIGGLTTEGEELSNALLLIEKLPICPDPTVRLLIWRVLVDKYIKTKSIKVTHAMCSILSRRLDFDLTKLLPVILQGIDSNDDNYIMTSLRLLRQVATELSGLNEEEAFWTSLTKQLEKKNETISKLIGELVRTMLDSADRFTFDQNFFGAIIALLYDPNTSFDTANPFIYFLGSSCREKKIVVFLYKRSFVQYLEQLPWRYENDQRVNDAIQSVCDVMTYSYNQSA